MTCQVGREVGELVEVLGIAVLQGDLLALDQPRSRSPCRKTSRRDEKPEEEPSMSRPIRETFPAGCASAANGATRRPSVRVMRSPIMRHVT
jgi:hypothetical protein